MGKVARSGSIVASVFNTEVYGGDTSFNSTLTVSNSPSANCRLKITMNLYLKPITPTTLTDIISRALAQIAGVRPDPNTKVAHYGDGDAKAWLIKEWKGQEWQNFVAAFKQQAALWNRQFCLMPPDDFPYFDIFQGNARYRPNVMCEFAVNVFGGPLATHNTIEVVNLNTAAGGAFRSHSRLYAAEDTTPYGYEVPISTGGNGKYSQPTITHEIGHLLGLPHIGVTRKLAHCSVAVVLDKMLGNQAPALYLGGTNGNACYGHSASSGDAGNIMGYGDTFAAENAGPWLTRLHEHTWMTLDMSKWKVEMKEIPPMSIVNLAKPK